MKRRINDLDPGILIVPTALILLLCVFFFAAPEISERVIESIRAFLSGELSVFYIGVGVFSLIATLVMAFGKTGGIRLGNTDKPQYSDFRWGAMIFTSTMAADILFYSLCEWALYYSEPRLAALGGETAEWASAYALFHWGPVPWSFYMVLAVSFGFMLHVRGRDRQRFSEAARPLFGKHVDGLPGRVIDILAVFALLCGTATTFSVSVPLLSEIVSHLTDIPSGIGITIAILIVIAVLYTLTVCFGLKGISRLAGACVWLFAGLLLYVLFGGGETRFILESGITSIGKLAQNFLGMVTWADPLRTSGEGGIGFVQNWTVFYWAYWLAWCVATPFFIGIISKGRTIRNTVLGGYGWGLAGTFTSFIILGGYGLAKETKGITHTVDAIASGGSISAAIVDILDRLPLSVLVFILLGITMIAFYATTFDALTMVVASYSCRSLRSDETPSRGLRAFWAVVLILFPIALSFSESSMHLLQSVSIIGAFPIGILIVLITLAFFKDSRNYLQERNPSHHG